MKANPLSVLDFDQSLEDLIFAPVVHALSEAKNQEKTKLFFVDTEFQEKSSDRTEITLISCAIVADDGRSYYVINAEADYQAIAEDAWLAKNVIPLLPLDTKPDLLNFTPDSPGYNQGWRTRKQMADELINFISLGGGKPIIWGDYNAFDNVAVSWIFGKKIDSPPCLPWTFRELQTVIEDLGNPPLPERKEQELEHHALGDALYLKRCFQWLRLGFYHPSLYYGSCGTITDI
jgi:3' exoribonuclease, RNase T-like